MVFIIKRVCNRLNTREKRSLEMVKNFNGTYLTVHSEQRFEIFFNSFLFLWVRNLRDWETISSIDSLPVLFSIARLYSFYYPSVVLSLVYGSFERVFRWAFVRSNRFIVLICCGGSDGIIEDIQNSLDETKLVKNNDLEHVNCLWKRFSPMFNWPFP